MNKPRILNEGVYFGKTPAVLELEKACTDMVNDKSPVGRRKYIKRIEDAIQLLINCDDVFIEPSGTYFTLFAGFKITDMSLGRSSMSFITDKNGVRFRNPEGKVLYIAISSNLFDNLTGEELTAVILHEVGHNMDDTISKNLSDLVLLLSANVNLIPYFIAERINYLLSKGIKAIPGLHGLLTDLNNLFSIPRELISSVLQVVSKFLFVNPMAVLYFDPMNILRNTSEMYSDTYAAAFGYGAALSTALAKLTKDTVSDKAIKAVPFFKYYLGLTSCINDLFMSFVSPHPNRVNRLATTISYLESSINQTQNPKLKKALMKDLNEQKAMLKAMAEGDSVNFHHELQARGILNKSKIKPDDWRHVLLNLFSSEAQTDQSTQGNLWKFTRKANL